MNLKKYILTLLEEKDIDTENLLEFENKNGFNIMPLNALIDMFEEQADDNLKKSIKNDLIKVDFINGDILKYFTVLAEKYVA